LDFLKVIITAIVYLASVKDCYTSLTRGEQRNAGRALGRRLWVKQGEEEHPILQCSPAFFCTNSTEFRASSFELVDLSL